jgi:carboxypeptidase PM20D1
MTKEYLNVYGQPSRTFYVAITHDEEVGKVGASGIAHFLSQQPFGRNGQFEFIIDEGTVILEEAFPTLNNPIAIIGVAEKGYLSIEYRIDIPPGHSSMPSTPTAIGILARGVDKLESTLKPSQFGHGPEMGLLLGITPYLKFPLRLVMSNIWLFGPAIQWVLTRKPGTDALQRTTTAVTLISGGQKDNILPTSASATVNHRLHTADSCGKILENNRRIINDDRLVPHIKSCSEPSPISPYGKDVYSYRIIEQTIRQTFEKDRQSIIVVPGLMLGGTDSRSYTNLSKNLYRFSLFIYHHDDLNRLHGDNERIRHSDMQRALNFYFHLILNNQLENLPETKFNSEL